MKLLPVTFAFGVLSAVCSIAGAQDATAVAPKEAEKLVLKLYPLGNLLIADEGDSQSNGNSGVPAHQMSRGGGFFSFPASASATGNASVQLGGGGLGGGGLGGGGLGGAQPQSFVAPHSPAYAYIYDSSDHHSDLIHLITANIDVDSWEENGGEATISAANDFLVVRQTASNHQAIRELLKQLYQSKIGGEPIKIELWWIPLERGERENLTAILQKTDAVTALNSLCDSSGGYHGTVQARNRMMCNLSSSHKMPVIVGRIPVVGAGAVGEQLIVNQLNLGISTQMTPRILEDWQGEGVQLTLQTAITSVKDLKPAENSGSVLDRFDLGDHSLDCNSICKFAEPMILGSMSSIGLQSGDLQDRELAVVVRITR